MMDKRTILIVEDSFDDQFLIESGIRGAGVRNTLKFFKTGAEALAYLAQCEQNASGLPVLIFLDLLLENEDGLIFLKAVRNNPATHRIPVVVLSQSSRQRDLRESYSLGANSFVSKDDQSSGFNVKIKCICDYWLKICQVPVA